MKKDWDLLIGETHGTLTVKQVVGTDRNGYTYLLCQCDCGSEKVIKASDFARGRVKTCGKLECKRKVSYAVVHLPTTGKTVSVIEARL